VSIELALVDAATNCNRDGATALLTLRSGAVIVGRLRRGRGVDTVMLDTPTGWVTVDVREIVAVEARR
jgi:hypothetical protein